MHNARRAVFLFLSIFTSGRDANERFPARSIFPVNTYLNQTTKRCTRRLLAGVACAFALAAPIAQASVRWATLEAIHQIENPTDSPRYGSCGELGAYQFLPTTWSMHSREPFRRALDRSASDAVAVRHYEYIKSNLERAGVNATPYMIGLAWNGGLDGAISGRAPRAAREYAQRVANLAASLNRDDAPAASAAPAAAPAPAPMPASAPIAAAPSPDALQFAFKVSNEPPSPLMISVPAAKPTPFLPTKPFLVAMR
jgi:hypothetical protein